MANIKGSKLKKKPVTQVYCRKHFCCHVLFPLSALEGSITANQYLVLQPDCLYPAMKHLYLDGSGIFPTLSVVKQ